MEAFGSIGYILLTTGLMTFTQTATGSYDVHFKSHEIGNWDKFSMILI